MAFSAIIVDDEPLAIEGLERLCVRSGLVEVAGTASNGEEALRLVEMYRPDAMFLDIGMPGLNGLAVAERLLRTARPPLVVFVTAYDHFATQAFDLAVADYVLKPVDPARLDRAIQRLESLNVARQGSGPRPQRAEEFWASSRGGMVRAPVANIRRIDAERDYVRLSVGDTSYLLRRPLSDIEARLDPELHLRIHRSTIVRWSDVAELKHLGAGAWAVVDDAGRSMRVGRRFLPMVKARLKHLVRRP